MKALIAALVFMLGGCVPVIQYQMAEKKLTTEIARRKDAEKRADQCEEQNKKLRESLRQRPVGSVIKPTELEAIKRKALEEAERKYKSRIIKGKDNQ